MDDERPTERVTHAHVRDVALPADAGTLALVTLDNELDGTPATLGPRGLAELKAALERTADRAARGQVVGVAVTGAPPHFAAGADLDAVTALHGPRDARAVAELGHAAFRLLGEMDVPSFAFVNGAAVGGGLELALHCTYRTAAADVRALALPEVQLGLVPGWGGCHLLPRIVGVRRALDLVVARPLAGNRPTDAAEARAIGLVDEVLEPGEFLEASLRWAADVLRGALTPPRRELDDEATWEAAIAEARAGLARLEGAARAPFRALDLIARARTASRDEAFAAEDEALTELLVSDELHAGIYASRATSRAARRPIGAPDLELARTATRVGVVGAGLMAGQLAVLVAHRLDVPVVMREVDDERAAAGLAGIRRQVDRLVDGGRMSTEDGRGVLDRISVGTDLAPLGDADLVIEAVTERMDVKRQVFASLEEVAAPSTVFATNTSALSVGAMAEHLRHPGRVVGMHFFNPVARMPLVEVVRAARSDDVAVATAFDVARRLGKTAVGVADRPGFVVNRLLLRMLADALAAAESGTPVQVVDDALRPLGLPMGPFALLDLVGLPVAQHVLHSLHDGLGERYPLSPGLERLASEGRSVVLPRGGRVDPAVQDAFGEPGGADSADGPRVLRQVGDGLAEEVGLMLDEGVVEHVEQVDVCMILGAGWPFHLGGITPYLDRAGHSERSVGRRFHAEGRPV